MPKKIILEQSKIDEIISLYKDGKLLKDIASHLGYSGPFIKKILKKNKIELRITYSQRKYELNNDYFDNIDTEEKAYFLGFLFADGNVHSKNNSISISLHKKDEKILKLFSSFIYKNEHCLYVRSNNQLALAFSSKNIKEKLIALGCVPNKSLVLKFPDLLKDNDIIRHFIRGYFDGDGSLSKENRKNRKSETYKFNIVSTKDFCKEVAKIITDNTGAHISFKKAPVSKSNDVTIIISVGGNRQTANVMDWLYKDATIYLERKYNKYLQLKELQKEIELSKTPEIKYKLSLEQINEIKKLRNEKWTIKAISQKFCRSEEIISKLLKL
jgi:hypothetical protein